MPCDLTPLVENPEDAWVTLRWDYTLQKDTVHEGGMQFSGHHAKHGLCHRWFVHYHLVVTMAGKESQQHAILTPGRSGGFWRLFHSFLRHLPLMFCSLDDA